MVFLSVLSYLQSLVLVLSLHPLHVSVTEIEFDEKDKALEIMMRVFIDDAELTMRTAYNIPNLDILNPPAPHTVDKMMGDYIKNHFKISLDSKAREVKYLGHEQEGEAFIFYVEVANVKKFKDIQISNDIITETHDDQSNLVHVTVRGKVRSLRLTKDVPADKLTFDAK
jgi:hypothetical protein